MPKILTRYSDKKDRVVVSRDFTIKRNEKKEVINPEVLSRTKQSERENSDINNIVARAKSNGGIFTTGAPTTRQAIYGDFRNADDFTEAQRKIAKFKEVFDSLSSDLRNRFNNNPAELLAFVKNKKNAEEAIELGLLPKPKVVEQPDDVAPKAESQEKEAPISEEKPEA